MILRQDHQYFSMGAYLYTWACPSVRSSTRPYAFFVILHRDGPTLKKDQFTLFNEPCIYGNPVHDNDDVFDDHDDHQHHPDG